MERLAKTQEIELSIENLAFGGRGVARRDGFVIFVDGAFPGDVVRAVITKARRSYAEARTIEVLEPAATRQAAACKHFGSCGGCSWQSLAYGTQVEFKQRQVSECFQHIAGIEVALSDEPLAADPIWRYRNKVEFSFAEGRDGGLELGFHRPGEWRRVVDIDDCLLHSELTNSIRNHVRGFARESGLGVYDQRSDTGFFRHLVLKEGANTGEVMLNLVTSPGGFPARSEFVSGLSGRFPELASVVWSINDTKASVASGFPYEVLAGRDHIHEEICGLRLKVSPASFLQTNTRMAERLYARALEYAGLSGEESVFDLYCGIGSISLLLARASREVFGVEIVEDAIRLAVQNAGANGIGNVEFTAGKVRAVLKDMRPARHPDVIVLDPPRAGASKKEIQRILELRPRRVVYVSCNASTLAGNTAQLVEGGYRLIRTGAVDMFPHTPHIETVALLDLAGRP